MLRTNVYAKRFKIKYIFIQPTTENLFKHRIELRVYSAISVYKTVYDRLQPFVSHAIFYVVRRRELLSYLDTYSLF